ncbi:hypothetical protein BJX64DRAFT_253986 [Aspergillus heterothallicus]
MESKLQTGLHHSYIAFPTHLVLFSHRPSPSIAKNRRTAVLSDIALSALPAQIPIHPSLRPGTHAPRSRLQGQKPNPSSLPITHCLKTCASIANSGKEDASGSSLGRHAQLNSPKIINWQGSV